MGTEGSPEPSKQGYGRNWKKWLVIYLVAGAIVYAIIYFVFIAGNGYGS